MVLKDQQGPEETRTDGVETLSVDTRTDWRMYGLIGWLIDWLIGWLAGHVSDCVESHHGSSFADGDDDDDVGDEGERSFCEAAGQWTHLSIDHLSMIRGVKLFKSHEVRWLIKWFRIIDW